MKAVHGRIAVAVGVGVLALGVASDARAACPVPWTVTLPANGAPQIGDDTGFTMFSTGLTFVGVGDDLAAYRTLNGTAVWGPRILDSTVNTPIPVPLGMMTTGEAVLTTTAGGFVYRQDYMTGATVWQVDTRRPACATDQVTADAGLQLFKYADAAFQSAIGDDLVIVPTRAGCGPPDGASRVYGLRASDGSVAWTFNGDGSQNADYFADGCAIDYDGNTAYCAANQPLGSPGQPSLFAINTTNGTLRWSQSRYGAIHTHPTMDYAGHLFVANYTGTLYQINTVDGSQVWQAPITATANVSYAPWFEFRTPTLNDGLYVTDSEGVVRRFTAGGALTWATQVGATTAPSLVPQAGKLYVGVRNGSIHQLDVTSGSDEGPVTVGSAVVSNLYLESSNNVVINRITGGAGTALRNFCLPWGAVPFIQLSPTSGPSGTTVSVQGGGFDPNETVTLSYAGTAVGTAQADDSGNLVASFVATGASGAQTVEADGAGASPTAIFTLIGCGPSTCPNGCCAANTCRTASFPTCGANGAACVTCDPTTANLCTASGACICGTLGGACTAPSGGTVSCTGTCTPSCGAQQLCGGGPLGGGACFTAGPCSTGQPGVCAAGTISCVGGVVTCKPNVAARPETCDGLDNDCDGVTDNGNPGGGLVCATGKLGVCAQGVTVCSGGAVSCNQNVAPSVETCDGKDNDCNGVTDNGNPGGGLACATGKLGVCGPGTTACSGGAVVCNQNLAPSPETCDGRDNDCDGVTDNGNPGGNLACTVSGKLGQCALGVTQCGGGAIQCAQVIFPQTETCDGKDNDCNGVTDNGNPGGNQACTVPGKLGLCAAGLTQCTGGALSCSQVVLPATETCDGKDNDCDGIADDNIFLADGIPNSCAAAGNKVVSVAPGATADLTGFIDSFGDDYFTVKFTGVGGPPSAYHPKITLLSGGASTGGPFSLAVTTGCSSGPFCGLASETFEENYNGFTKECAASGNCNDLTPRVTTFIVHVQRSGTALCTQYTVRASN